MSKYKPGESGNPGGRPKGASDKRTAMLRELEVDLPSLLAKLKEKALEGDTTALRFLLDRLLPQRKPCHELVEIPELMEAKTLTDKVAAIMDCIAKAQLAPDVGAQLIAAIGVAAKVEEVSQLKDRLEVLERTLKLRSKT